MANPPRSAEMLLVPEGAQPGEVVPLAGAGVAHDKQTRTHCPPAGI